MASEPTTDRTDDAADDTATEQTAADSTPEPDPAAGDGAEAPAAVEAPAAKKATRKRATTSRAKKTSAPEEPTAQEAAGSDTGEPDRDADAAVAEAAPPAKRSRSRRAPAAARAAVLNGDDDVDAAPEAPDAEQAPDPFSTAAPSGEAHPQEASTEGAIATDLAVTNELDEAEELDEAGDADADADAPDADGGDVVSPPTAQVPSFGLLFKAPEPVAPRRRRATSAAGAPAPASSEASDGGRSDSRRGADLDQGDLTRPDADSRGGGDVLGDEGRLREEEAGDGRREDEPTGFDDAEGGGRRSRRRGGRGRRPRGGDVDQDGQGSSEGGADDGSGPEQDQRPARRGRRGSTADAETREAAGADGAAADSGGSSDRDGSEPDDEGGPSSRRRRRRRRGGAEGESEETRSVRARDEVTALKGSTRLEAKKQRRREGREAGRRRTIITEAEFLARRESVERVMVVRERDNKTQIAVLEDGVLVEHYVSRESGASMIGNVYLGRVQNVLPSMEAAFVDIGKGRNAVLYAGEVNWDAAGLEGNVAKRIENALGSGDTVLTQVTKDPIGHKGARLTSQVSLPGRFLVYVPEASMTGISRKLPDTERARLKSILKRIVPDDAGVIVRTAAEGASEEELTADIARLTKAWEKIQAKAESAAKKKGASGAPVLLHGEPDLTVKVIRDVFNEDFSSLVVAGERAWAEVSEYLEDVAPDLAKRLSRWTGETDLFAQYRVDEQIAKALDRKVWLPSGGSLVIDRTEAMTVVDVNTGKFVGSGGNLEETVTKNNIEAAEEIVRQLRLRDIGGIIVVDFIDMVLESNRDLVVRRLLECLGRDRTKHQVAEVTSLGLVQMTRKRVGSGLLEVFSEPCAHCAGRGVIVHTDPMDDSPAEDGAANGRGRARGRATNGNQASGGGNQSAGSRGGRGGSAGNGSAGNGKAEGERPQPTGPTAAQIAAAAHAAALKANASSPVLEAAAAGDSVADDASTLGGSVTAEDAEAAASGEGVEAAQSAGEDAAMLVGEAGPEAADHLAEPSSATEFEAPAWPETSDPSQAPVPDEATPSAPTADDAPEPEPQPEPETDRAPERAPGRPRRRRGRVVAPAGPPGRSEVRVIAPEES